MCFHKLNTPRAPNPGREGLLGLLPSLCPPEKGASPVTYTAMLAVFFSCATRKCSYGVHSCNWLEGPGGDFCTLRPESWKGASQVGLWGGREHSKYKAAELRSPGS